jgi:oxygen-independent coproporphyrinogen-3 oxidase
VQSFDDRMLDALGRIHSSGEAERAIVAALASFERVNVDLMYGLPAQDLAGATADIRKAIAPGAPHISAYQLTIEPNTVFFSKAARAAGDDLCADMQIAVEELLAENGFEHYETSAFARPWAVLSATTSITGNSATTSASAPARTAKSRSPTVSRGTSRSSSPPNT